MSKNCQSQATRSKSFRATTTSLLVLLGIICTSSMNNVRAESLHSPLRLRFNADLLKDLFHKRDQEILNVFANISLGYVDLSGTPEAEAGSMVQDMTVSILPKENIQFDDFDFNLSFDEKEYIGMDSKDLRFQGVGKLRVGTGENRKFEEFQIEGPIDEFKFEYIIGENGTSKACIFKAFTLTIDPTKVQITHQGDIKLLEQGQNAEKVRNTIVEELNNQVNIIRQDVMTGSVNYLPKLPILNITPLIALYHTTNTAEKVHFAGDYLEYDFTPQSIKLVNELNQEFLKPIDHQFAPMRDDKGQRAFQLVIDENLPNSFFSQIISYEKKLSLREMLSADPRFALFRQLLTTSTVGMAIPSFKEEYGDNKSIDVIFTVSNDWIEEMVDSLTPSGFSLDAKGNFKIHMNIGAQIIVEKKKGQWEDSRKMIMTLGLKGKIFVADAEFDNRTLVILPRGIELSNLKIFKGDEEQFLEQMLAQSLIGVQLDQFKKSLKPQIFPLKDFNNPPELQCFGFNLTNLEFFINKGYIQVNSNYKKIERSDLTEIRQEFCDAFEGGLRSSPEKFQDILGHYVPGLDHLKRTEEAFQSENDLRKRMRKQENPDFVEHKARELPQINLPEDIAKEIEADEIESQKKNKYSKHAKQSIEGQREEEL